jgi:hypothetical protein
MQACHSASSSSSMLSTAMRRMPHALTLLRAGSDRPRRRRAAECGKQFPPSDGDCHTPLPCEVRKLNATRVLSLTARYPAWAGRTPRHSGAPASLRFGAVRRCVGARFSLRATRPAQQRQANLRARMTD